MRFVALQDPTDRWTVFDTASEEPAEFGGRVLIGLTSHEALRLAAVANDEAGYREINVLGSRQSQ
ncbi:MAG: hypothetical protein E5X74_30655 [Mesorhizobium sp.]|uniref:hypothetical protein n=1 Tax=Mesorhizobium sp. TaxID=1871066 RepID=UPI000FE7B692|nr:hypothetical protein [Mesorhizobium sp.]RWL97892.1 MAG: hypothetical protein EOR71_31800 [Mesorhizobium sp.]TIO47674.1 MAG: hypothetical protein E5X78_31955 [Mesorhizobium sp.]TIO56129.1 MAG: hypothetical protein E5X79_32070 [Mesorhizobium sp.]TIO73565.1 MAG: hypothetical protein E5X75_27760 [Mesorhizobium sp.]TIO81018.1 MAG: hypothetical protein E5X74_30655 [Mesorhizobium sp.]